MQTEMTYTYFRFCGLETSMDFMNTHVKSQQTLPKKYVDEVLIVHKEKITGCTLLG